MPVTATSNLVGGAVEGSRKWRVDPSMTPSKPRKEGVKLKSRWECNERRLVSPKRGRRGQSSKSKCEWRRLRYGLAVG